MLHAHAVGRCPHARPRTVLTVLGISGDLRPGIELHCAELPFSFPVTLTETGGIYDVYCLSSSLNHDNCLKLLYSQNGHPIKNGNVPPGNSRTTHKQVDGVNSTRVPLMTVLITRGPVAWMWVAWVRVGWPKLVGPSTSQCSLGETHQLDLYLHWSFFTGASVAPMNPGPSWLQQCRTCVHVNSGYEFPMATKAINGLRALVQQYWANFPLVRPMRVQTLGAPIGCLALRLHSHV